MATSRLIRRGFVDSDRVNRLDWFSECLYHRLLLVADDYGLFDARIPYLKTQLFGMKPNPVRDADLQRALASVESAGLVRIYAVDGKPYLQILGYGQRKLSKPKWPPPPDAADCGNVQQIAADCGEPRRITADCGEPRKTTAIDVYGDVDVYGDGEGESDAEGVGLCAPASAQEAGPPPGGGGTPTGSRRPKDWEEVRDCLAACPTLALTADEKATVAEVFYFEADAAGWVDNKGRPIWNWKSAAHAFAVKWAQNRGRTPQGLPGRQVRQLGVRVDPQATTFFDK